MFSEPEACFVVSTPPGRTGENNKNLSSRPVGFAAISAIKKDAESSDGHLSEPPRPCLNHIKTNSPSSFASPNLFRAAFL